KAQNWETSGRWDFRAAAAFCAAMNFGATKLVIGTGVKISLVSGKRCTTWAAAEALSARGPLVSEATTSAAPTPADRQITHLWMPTLWPSRRPSDGPLFIWRRVAP